MSGKRSKAPQNIATIFLFLTTLIMTAASVFLAGQFYAVKQEITKINDQNQLISNELAETKDLLEEVQSKMVLAEGRASSAEAELEKAKAKPKKIVYLTFDDGPSAITPDILATLKKYNVKATFFVVGNAYPEHLKQIADEGHTIGLHSYTHDYKKIYSSEEAFFTDLQQISNVVKEATGIDSKIIRFPGGSSNTVSRKYKKGIMTTLVQMIGQRGYIYYDWNAANGDASGKDYTPEQLLENVKNSSQSSVINLLMHEKKATAESLEAVIDYYMSQGYEFRPITLDTTPVQHTVNN